MNDLVYPRERTLGTITLVLGILGWLLLVGGTLGLALLWLGVGFVFYLFAHSALIAHIKGNGVELSEAQFPDLWAQFTACCERLQMSERPTAYVLNGNGGLNAFATKFLGATYVVLLADVVDAMHEHPDGVRFYLGHELGHLRMRHLSGTLLRWPVLWMPLLGAAYSRARESTCDLHGLACSSSPEGAARALAALSAGTKRWKNLDFNAYLLQMQQTAGFWMSFHELTAGYPWLTKRVARMITPANPMPPRAPMAHVLAAFVPYAGRLGALGGILMLFYAFVFGIALAVPFVQKKMADIAITEISNELKPTEEALTAYYEVNGAAPPSLEAAQLATTLKNGSVITYDAESMSLSLPTVHGMVRFVPTFDDNEELHWSCQAGEGLKEDYLPASCRAAP